MADDTLKQAGNIFDSIAKIIHDVKSSVDDITAVVNNINTSRSVVIEVDNNTSIPLERIGDHHDHGGFVNPLPKRTIDPRSANVFGTQSLAGSIATGTEGTATYTFDGNMMVIHWDNPFIGENDGDVALSGVRARRYGVLATIGHQNHSNSRYEVFEVPSPYSVKNFAREKQVPFLSSLRDLLPGRGGSLRLLMQV